MDRRHALALGLAVLVAGSACGERPTAVLGEAAGGCVEALREQAAATAAIDAAEKRAAEQNPARVLELQGIASEGKQAVLTAADLRPCQDTSGDRGVAVDLADLRARYRVVVERTSVRLSEAAARPAPVAPTQRRNDNKGKSKGD